MRDENLSPAACIAGGGPAGLVLGLLLARAGVEVLVLEKHADFLRDFRGDTIHPSTLEVMHELGLLEDLLRLPHQRAYSLQVRMGEATFPVDFSGLATRCKFIAFMPQWDFLNFVAARASEYPGFRLQMSTAVTGLVEEGGRVTGVRATAPAGPLTVRASLVIGCDGRHSDVRAAAGLEATEIGAPMDVLWFRLPRRAGDPESPMGRFASGTIFIMLNQGAHWQCGYVIAKGALEPLRAKGLPAFRNSVSGLAPFVADRVDELRDWEQLKLLTVRVDRLERWYREGLLCIGDAAHAMSPVGGVGINLAIQDAVATANLLAGPLLERRLSVDDLKRVQERREFPTRVTQRIQVAVQKRIISRFLGGDVTPPLPVRLMARFPLLRRIPGWLIGNGVRPEHVRS
jgi:2-polyprenyl-6-methoxyphenol hydroxylase-like FAD-dependent oxidoreductase